MIDTKWRLSVGCLVRIDRNYVGRVDSLVLFISIEAVQFVLTEVARFLSMEVALFASMKVALVRIDQSHFDLMDTNKHHGDGYEWCNARWIRTEDS